MNTIKKWLRLSNGLLRMFRKLVVAGMDSRQKRTLGVRLASELSVCSEDIMKVFGISNFDRDYEDTWEWIEGRNEERVHVNVSRPHNWKTGDYEVPIVINVLFPAAIITEDLFLEKAQCLANKLKTNVWIGSVVRKDPNDAKYDFMIDREFAPQQ